MSTTLDVFLAEPAPSFGSVLELARERLREFASHHGLGVVPEIVCSLHDPSENVTAIDYSSRMVWSKNDYVWFVFGEAAGGTDAYCSELTEEELVDWEGEMRASPRAGIMATHIRRCLAQRRRWYFRRSAGQPAIVNLGYGFLAAALAEAADGFVYSGDGAWDYERFPCRPEEFRAFYFDPESALESKFTSWSKTNLAFLKTEGMTA